MQADMVMRWKWDANESFFSLSLSPSNAQQDTLSADIKQPGLWGVFSEQEVFAVQLIYREKLCWRC